MALTKKQTGDLANAFWQIWKDVQPPTTDARKLWIKLADAAMDTCVPQGFQAEFVKQSNYKYVKEERL
jgi:hypothetical protein